MRTYIYVDGFNLYHRALKGTPYKWLNLSNLFRDTLAHHHKIEKIKYFTARVSSRGANGGIPQRQDVYLRALQSHCSNVELIFGSFRTHKVRAPLARPRKGQKFVEILRTEEKKSDVNLAVHLLNDGWMDAYDCAILVTNDSDFSEAMRLTKQLPNSNKLLGLLTPGNGIPSAQLLLHANFHGVIRANALKKNQLPTQIPGTSYTKPSNW